MLTTLHRQSEYKLLKRVRLILLLFIAALPMLASSNSLPVSSENNLRAAPELGLTSEEHEWLKHHKVIRVGVKHSWKPIEYISEHKKFRGITIDYMNKLEALLNVNFEKVDFDEISAKDIDMLSSVSNPNSLDSKFLATNSFLTFDHAIYVHKDNNDIVEVQDLSNKKVAVFRYGQLVQFLENDYKTIRLYKIDIIEQAFNDMEIKNSDAYVGNEMVIDYEANLHGISFLKKVNYVPIKTTLTMAVRKDWPIFLSILNKSLLALEVEQESILQNWSLSTFKETNLYTLIGIALLSLLIISTLFRSLKLKKKMKEQELEAQKNIWRQAHYDAQTELPNRLMFNIQLTEKIKNSPQGSLPICLLYIDLDAFKDVNDLYGHAAGDRLIKEVAQRIKKCVRPEDIVARLGGDEFTVILTNIIDTKTINERAKKILTGLSEPFVINEYVINITSSIGSSIYPNDTRNISEFVKNADMAMYEAKKVGKNCFKPFTQSMQDNANHKKNVATSLKSAITKNEFVLYYQPIVDLRTNQLAKAEALIRWQHPAKGLVGPLDFIDIAEETNAIIKIGDWVFKQALQDALTLQQSINSNLSISINVSPKQFNSDCLLTQWPNLLKKNNVANNSIGIEITEGLLLESTLSTNSILKDLRKAGAHILIDDFGTGYSSLSYLKKIDADYLKIDRSFIKNLPTDSDDIALCEAIIVMAHKLGLKVIAEGIETDEQKSILHKMGCDYGQGYLFSKPVPIEVLLSQYRPSSSNEKINTLLQKTTA